MLEESDSYPETVHLSDCVCVKSRLPLRLDVLLFAPAVTLPELPEKPVPETDLVYELQVVQLPAS